MQTPPPAKSIAKSQPTQHTSLFMCSDHSQPQSCVWAVQVTVSIAPSLQLTSAIAARVSNAIGFVLSRRIHRGFVSAPECNVEFDSTPSPLASRFSFSTPLAPAAFFKLDRKYCFNLLALHPRQKETMLSRKAYHPKYTSTWTPPQTAADTMDSDADAILKETSVKELVESGPECIQWIRNTEFESLTSVYVQELSPASFANGTVSVAEVENESEEPCQQASGASEPIHNLEVDDDFCVQCTPPPPPPQNATAAMGHTGERSLAEIEVEDALINEAEEIDCEMVEAVAEIDDDEEEIPSSVKGIDEEESQLALSDNESEDDEIELEELDHFALVDKLNAVAAEGAILTGRGQEQSAGEDNLKSDIGDRVADSLAGDEADGLLDDASGIREQAEMEALICAPSMDINPAVTSSISTSDTCSNAASIIIQDTRHHAESDHSKKKVQESNTDWEAIYNSFRAPSYTPTPEPSQTLMPPVHATDPDSAIISIPLSKDGTFNEKDHPNLSQESLAKVHSALESCRKKGSKFPKRITIKREIVKKGGGHGGVVKRPVQRHEQGILSTVWNPLKKIWSGLGFPASKDSEDSELA